MKTLQTIFNTVSKHLLKQNKVCENNFSCAYRGPNGLKCAVGVLIKDKHFKKIYNNDGIYHDGVIKMLTLSGIPTDKESLIFLTNLQRIHDTGEVENWKTKLKNTAKAYNLKCSF